VLRGVPTEPVPRRATLCAVVFAFSVAGWIALVRGDAQSYWHQTDAIVYRDAGLAVLHGHPLYPELFGPFQLPFTYPPVAGLVFAVFSGLPFGWWQAGLSGVSLVAALVAAHASMRLAGRRALPGALLLAAVALWLEPVDMTLHFGQINVVLLALVLVDVASDRRWSGIGVGLAAGIKLTPLIVVPYLWFTGRRRAAVVSAATFAGTVAVGGAVLPRDASRFWLHQFLAPGDRPNRLVNQSLNGALLRVLGRTDGSSGLWLAVAAVVLAGGLAVAVLAARRGQPLLGICLCGATGLLVSPVSWSHHWVYVIPVLALAADERWSRVARAAWAGTVVGLFAWWPSTQAPRPSGLLRLLPHDNNRELSWNWWQVILGDYYVLAALVFLAGAATMLQWQRRTGGARR
jgi:alpha-1,2-mannosyltransferase